ncbi:acyltransferase family protein [Massilia sp. S19_KUP03_FR1]|uniref:acyltransferase family protein n=1 Tax=Massilia sp. S19_KUP03_FR1 TaxID=3025503 RepID=UPI002FCD48E8
MPSTLLRRTAGLDTLRACAIALVFMYHYMVFVSHTPTFGWLSTAGWVGVDLFFVLSGYLIADQLLRGVQSGQPLSLWRFYLRRALRTWPAFWVVLAAYFAFPTIMGGKPPPPLWTFLTFTQNIGLQPGTAFSQAWSLCIEEQFYLALPLALLAAVALHLRRWQAWCALALLLAVGIGLRAYLWHRYALEEGGQVRGYMAHVYYASLCRFDEFLPGVAVALVRHGHPHLWQRLMEHGRKVLLAGVAGCAALLYGALNFYYIEDYGYGFFMTAFGYSLLAMAFALLVIGALSPHTLLHRARIPGARQLALWSYSIYLIHKPVGNIVGKLAVQWQLPGSVTLTLTIVLSLLAGALLFYLVEQPFMRLRARLAPSNFAPDMASGAVHTGPSTKHA